MTLHRHFCYAANSITILFFFVCFYNFPVAALFFSWCRDPFFFSFSHGQHATRWVTKKKKKIRFFFFCFWLSWINSFSYYRKDICYCNAYHTYQDNMTMIFVVDELSFSLLECFVFLVWCLRRLGTSLSLDLVLLIFSFLFLGRKVLYLGSSARTRR